MPAEPISPEALTSPDLAVRHGFFTRRGGVSEGPFASLNCSVSSRDDPAAVAEIRARVAEALRVEPAALVGLHQVHSPRVLTLPPSGEPPWTTGEGPQADGLVTDRPGIALGIVTGDCAPVLFADAEAGVIGAAHAGWRGALAGVLEPTLAAMLARGARAEQVRAVVGPCIAQASYEVGEDLRHAILGRRVADARHFAPGHRAGHWQFDLSGYCLARLASAGVGGASRIAADTCADATRFFSHRRRTLTDGGPLGLQISAIVL